MMEKSEMMKRMKKGKGDIKRDKDWGTEWEKKEKEEVEKVIRESMTLKCTKLH